MQTIHLVPHTHWDREWYKPFQNFRVKLVYVIDSLLQILESDPSFSSFMLDGQTIVLEDYLQIKPENAGRLKDLISAGRIQVGPWYVQPDEFAPDGESLIRNLSIGRSISGQFGKPMSIGYLPDSFGHSGQIPLILQGFGMDSAVVMRGVDTEAIQITEFRWKGTNGDQVLAVFLPEGYSSGMFLPENYRGFRQRILCMIRKMRKWASTDQILILNGVDHQFPQAQIPAYVERFNQDSKRFSLQLSSLDDYLDAVRAENPDLPTLSGSLRVPARNRVHPSIASTRIYQKKRNREMESLLENYVEPISTINWIKGAEYPAGLIDQAWKILIQNQTHDGICGCCLDEVHREMDQRFLAVEQIGQTLQNAGARALARRIPADGLLLVVYNNALVQGVQVVRARIFTKMDDFTIQDAAGRTLPYQIEGTQEVDLAEKSIWTLYLKGSEPAKQVDIRFPVEFDFNVGYRVFSIVAGKGNSLQNPELTLSETTVENDHLKVEINQNGSFHLTDKETGTVYRGLHTFEDRGDAGDTYNYSPVPQDTIATSQNIEAEYEIVRTGPLTAEVIIDYPLSLPAKLADGDQERSQGLVPFPIQTRMTVQAHKKRLDIRTRIDNTVRDHRLRVIFPTGIASDQTWAETQFGKTRQPVRVDDQGWKKKGWKEKPLPIYSQQRFVYLQGEQGGLAVLNKGLPEYEVYPDQRNAIAITLVRSVGLMGKADLLVRPGRPSGIPVPTPDAQCPGSHELEYSLYPFSGVLGEDQIPDEASRFNAPALAVQSRLNYKRFSRIYGVLSHLASLETLTGHLSSQLEELEAGDFKLATVDDSRLAITAVKKAELGEALILRLYNSSSETASQAALQLGIPVSSAWQTDLNEEPLRTLENLRPGVYRVPAVEPSSLITLKFQLAS
ncbi:MAG: glycoside hydrolase family 38 C-terminal domain-containing protein [Anaerolineales bacterium]